MRNCYKSCLEIFQQKHAIDILLIIEEEKRLGFNELQEKLDINTATLQRRLEDLQEKRFVEKIPCINDSRSTYYLLAKRGEVAAQMLVDFRDYLIKSG